MGNETWLLFDSLVLDTPNRSLLRGTEKIVLRLKTFAVPGFLIRNPHSSGNEDRDQATPIPDPRLHVSNGPQMSIECRRMSSQQQLFEALVEDLR